MNTFACCAGASQLPVCVLSNSANPGYDTRYLHGKIVSWHVTQNFPFVGAGYYMYLVIVISQGWQFVVSSTYTLHGKLVKLNTIHQRN